MIPRGIRVAVSVRDLTIERVSGRIKLEINMWGWSPPNVYID